ncbi:MAG TPA: sialidase family protein [Pirellulales bacterium]|jgi:predicted neuraminidase
MKSHRCLSIVQISVTCLVVSGLSAAWAQAADEKPSYRESLVFPLNPQHNHAPGIVECPNGDLLVSWYRGAGERSADDVAVFGARQRKGRNDWSEAFLLVDTPGFPDCNTTMMIDAQKRLWLFWPLILANTWESCLTEYRTSSDYQGDGPPKWDWQGVIPLAPPRFAEKMNATLDSLGAEKEQASIRAKVFTERVREMLKDKLSHRLGWQPRCKPTVLPSGRILLPLYTDTYSVSVMAISDDNGNSWHASEPICGFGNIQPAVLRRNDGTLVAYMRENGILDKIRISESKDDGETWGPVGVADLPNPGAGIDGVRLANGHWLLIYNDTTKGRNSLAVSISEDEGKTWPITRHLEKHEDGSYHYPAVIQGADGTLHFIYSYFVKGGKSMKHIAANEAWVRQLDAADPSAK